MTLHRSSHFLPEAAVCTACGTQFIQSVGSSPIDCPICLDDRQYVGWAGQQWTSSAELSRTHEIVFSSCAGVVTMHLAPSFAIGQRAFLVPQPGGMVMWECLSTVTDAALERIHAMGGVKAIAISHPHFYTAMIEWSDALGGVPVYLHEADRQWAQYSHGAIRYWIGERQPLSDDMVLVHLPGHFGGSAGLWWKTGPRPGGSLFPGDAIQVVMDRRFTTFMYSYPNAIPLGPEALARLEDAVADLAYEDLFGFAPGREIIGNARSRVDASFARYRQAIAA